MDECGEACVFMCAGSGRAPRRAVRESRTRMDPQQRGIVEIVGQRRVVRPPRDTESDADLKRGVIMF